ncbi:MAG: glycosyltransferase family 4 protein, partial [Desulfitobacterium hafniense]|nr:glycosyltransferase family 4 protein [Desulfitobacterium hafniense]
MKITLLTAYFYPEITAATHLLSDLTQDFAKYGAEVTVVTSIPTRGIDEETRKEYKCRNNEKAGPNIRIIRVGTDRDESKNFIVRAFRYGLNAYLIYHTAKQIESDVYLVSSTPPFLGVAGAFLSKKTPTVYNLQDVFPDSLVNAGKTKEGSLLIRICRKVERYIYKKQTNILTISRDFKNLLLVRGTPENKISMVYNWIDENQVVAVLREKNILISRYGLNKDKFYVTYCGNIGHSRS